MIESMILNMIGAFVQHIGTALVISVPIYLIVLVLRFFIKKKDSKSKYRCIVEFMFLGYIVTALSVTGTLSIKISDFSGFHMSPNLMPLVNTVRDLISYPSSVLEQVLLNIAFFIPFGVLFTLLYMKNKKIVLKTILVAIAFSVSIETLEYFLGRYMDIDDVIWNTLGAIIGSNICLIVSNILKKNKKEKIIVA